jgi:hypothetical protein
LGQGADLGRLVFNVINFFALDRGSRVETETGTTLQQSLRLGGWLLTIQNAPEISAVISKLNDSGGYAFTHVCNLERDDGAAFSWSEADEVLDFMFIFFSFCRGALTAPALPVGFDANGKAVFARWGNHVVDSWRSRFSWFPRHDPQLLQVLATVLFDRWSQPFWKHVLRRGVRMYVSANWADPLDTAIVTAQMGLELPAWSVLVEDQGWLVERDGRLHAPGKLRLLLKWADIPTGIPAELESLINHAKAKDWDGPAAVAGVRNELVHPKRAEGLLSSAVLRDAWLLAVRYLELSLLKVAGYEGDYVDRITTRFYGHAERVPWSADHGGNSGD